MTCSRRRVVDPPSAMWRALKALGLAFLILWFGTTAHIAGGGQLSITPWFLALLAPLLGACLALSRHRIGFLGCIFVLAAGQLYLHFLISAASHGLRPSEGRPSLISGGGSMTAFAAQDDARHGAGMTSPGTAGAGLTHLHDAAGADPTMAGMDHSAPSMLLMHVLGTVLSAAVVANVEALLWVLTVLILPWIIRLLPLSLPRPAPRLIFWRLRPPRLRPRVYPADPPRGPPSLLALS
ncbi:hypothetical protein NBM05_10305 [Rothia sp. AR01]|uniref:Uncharacterized protein n=1 Tax=Rothia santali TaxID=2949643 RepID=A0A9X2KI01_9MICC|nr:hypothetical protein [Rothia santali]MCP3426382.1 hypothetical protein [Rothia santali]